MGVACALGIVILVIAIFHSLISISPIKTFASSVISLILIFLVGFAMWAIIISNVGDKKDFLNVVFVSANNSIKMFAFGNDEKAFFDATRYADTKIYDAVILCCKNIGQIGAFIAVSTAVIKSVWNTSTLFLKNFLKSVCHLHTASGDSSFSKSNNYVYTDLPFEHIEPIIEKMNKSSKSTLKVVVLKSLAVTQYGSELCETLKINGYQVVNEGFDVHAFAKYSMLSTKKTVNFYSIFEKDSDNMKFAETAVKFLNNNYFGKRGKKNGNVNFFVSIQDETMNDKTDYSIASNGRVRFVNEYDWVASKFVFLNPITRFMESDSQRFDEIFNKTNAFNVRFLGFGNINRALLQKMLITYQFPSEHSHVNYTVYDLEAKKLVDSFKNKYQCFSENYTKLENKDKFYPQPDFLKYIKDKDVDVTDGSFLMSLAEEIVKEIVSTKDDPFINPSRNLIIVSLGNQELNISISIKLRQYIKNVAETYGKDTLMSKDSEQGKRFKKVIIYPYIKDNHYFMQNHSLFNKLTLGYIGKDLYGGNDGKTKLSRKEKAAQINVNTYYSMIKSAYSAEKGFEEYENSFNSYRSYISEVDPEEYVPGGLPKEIKKLGEETVIRLLSDFRKASYKAEECPLVIFGRGSYIGDDLNDMIFHIAKLINRIYSRGVNLDNMDEKWVHLSYPMQRANIDAVLALPFRLGVLGYKIVWDKNRVIPKYLKTPEKKKEKAKKYLSENDKQLVEAFIKEEGIGVLNRECKIPKFDEAFESNRANYFGLLSERFRKHIANITLSSSNVKEEFSKCYKTIYENYCKSPDLNKEAMYDLVKDYYVLVYKCRLTKQLVCLRNMEHNRWYLTSADCNAVPRSREYVNFNIKDNKSKDRVRLLCMASNDGLEKFAEDTLKAMVNERKIFATVVLDEKGDEKYIGDIGNDFNEFEFDFTKEKTSTRLKLFENIFKMVYKNDYMQYDVVDSILKEEVNDLMSKDKSSVKYNKVHSKNFIAVMKKSNYVGTNKQGAK